MCALVARFHGRMFAGLQVIPGLTSGESVSNLRHRGKECCEISGDGLGKKTSLRILRLEEGASSVSGLKEWNTSSGK